MRAFSLVELSIVLVILGLLTGGVLTGQALIKAAELRAIPTEYNKYMTAIYAFRDRYMALPGDMTNATQFWGIAATGTGDCNQTDSRTLDDTRRTCNGDGDGIIDYKSNPNYPNEIFRTWHHLANAGLIEGSYSGIPYSSTNGFVGEYGVAMPTSRFSGNTGWRLMQGYCDVAEGRFPGYGCVNRMWFSGRNVGTCGDHWICPSLTPEEMWQIDTKMDDGKPGGGKLTTIIHSWIQKCYSDTTSNATYQVKQTGIWCIPIFVPGF